MAVSEMNFISMIGPLEKINDIVNICGKSGAFQPDNVFSFYSNLCKKIEYMIHFSIA